MLSLLEVALKLLKKIEDAGFQAYLVGGFVRDYLLGKESRDIDVCTTATPMELCSILEDACIPHENYGSVTVFTKHVRFEITTMRKELGYTKHRRPTEVVYITDLLEDLKRRDFTINTFCMNQTGEVLDLLHAKDDLNQGIIRTVKDSYESFTEDSLRMLRAVRFAVTLSFRLDDAVKEAILQKGYLLRELSYQRKKEELEKIFLCPNAQEGVSLLLSLRLDEDLDLPNLSQLSYFGDLMGIWTLLDVDQVYPFSRNERELMRHIRQVLDLDVLDPVVLYRYGLYVCSIAGDIQHVDKIQITKKHHDLPIHSRKEIALSPSDICASFAISPGPILKEMISFLEEAILRGEVENTKVALTAYLQKKTW